MKEDVNSPRLPKLVIKSLGHAAKEVCELEQARERLNFKKGIIQVDGKRVRSWDELVALVSQDKYANMEFVDVLVTLTLVGG
jgi:PDZ domain-containing secreted protein